MPGKDGTGPRSGGSGKGQGMGAGGQCVCPNCGFASPHTRRVPCTSHICPQCGKTMIRKD